jgi:hypothetical protein
MDRDLTAIGTTPQGRPALALQRLRAPQARVGS